MKTLEDNKGNVSSIRKAMALCVITGCIIAAIGAAAGLVGLRDTSRDLVGLAALCTGIIGGGTSLILSSMGVKAYQKGKEE